MMINMMNNNMSNILAEDAGVPELRNPLAGGMQAMGWLSRLIRLISRKH